MNTVIFDLDGTISDPAEGITRCINHALAELGHPTYPESDLLKYIGPHLNITFSELAGLKSKADLARAIELYRERYIPIGYKENRLYDGIVDILDELVDTGSLLCIATTKRQDIAASVLKYFGISHYFTQIHGCDLDRSKADLLRDVISDSILGKRPMVMIGDRDTDFLAATEVGMSSIAVQWGYGRSEEYELASDMVKSPVDLPEAIVRNAQQVNAPDIATRRR
ncbi:HAD hydrolase-like protein [Thiolapillus brandeum]|nr:HAD hydrolase-like protein [Thiolapillus brandeum]